MTANPRACGRLVVLLVSVLLASCSSGTTGDSARAPRAAATTTTTATTSTTGSPAAVGTRVCSTSIYQAPTPPRTDRPDDLRVGPVLLGGINQPQGGNRTSLADRVEVTVVKVPLSVFGTSTPSVRVAVSDPRDAVRIVYDDADLERLNAGRYRFAEGATAVDLPGPTACGVAAQGLIQFNGGFVAREPTCATIIASVDGAEAGRGRAPFVGGSCP